MRPHGRGPLASPARSVALGQADVAAVVALLSAGELGSGRGVERFEAALSRALGAPRVSAVSSTTAAFQLAFQVLGVGPGRALWMPANGDLGAAAAAQACGGNVEFLDVDRASGNLDLRALEERLATGALPHVLVAAHHGGLPCELEWLLTLKQRHDFALLEDATEALGARVRFAGRWFRAGEHPEVEASVFSFDAGALVSTGRGGAVSTHDDELATRLRGARSLVGCAEDEACGRPARALGLDCALDDLPAALGASQLETLAERASARREIALRYLGEVRGFGLPPSPASKDPAWQRFPIQCAADERDALRAFLAERRIPTASPPAPLSAQPWFQARAQAAPCPNAEARARTILCLPIDASLSHSDHGRVIAALAEWQRMRRAA